MFKGKLQFCPVEGFVNDGIYLWEYDLFYDNNIFSYTQTRKTKDRSYKFEGKRNEVLEILLKHADEINGGIEGIRKCMEKEVLSEAILETIFYYLGKNGKLIKLSENTHTEN